MNKQEQYRWLAELVDYNPTTGCFTWRSTGKTAHIRQSKGYIYIKKGGSVAILAHRLAWFISTGALPVNQIDHINHIKTDNRIQNLREATNAENHRNKLLQNNNTSGVVGVALNRQKTKWQAYIKVDGRRLHLGVFDNFEEAVSVRKVAEAQYFKEFANAY